MTTYNYSVIIPHKNIPKLLERCLQSIPRRKDLQIIVVDDNSDPAIVDFDEFPGLNDSFVEVYFTKEDKGAGYARNVGLAKARGDMLLFADADDFFNYCIYDILEEYRGNHSDIVYFKSNSLHSENYTTTDRGVNFANELIDRFKEDQDKTPFYSTHVVWGKLYNRLFIVDHQITFSETRIANDVMFSGFCTYYAKTLTVDSRALYCVTHRPGSIQIPRSRPFSAEERLIDIQENWQKLWFLRRHGVDNKFFSMWISLFLLREYFSDKKNYKMAERKILSIGFTRAYIRIKLLNAFIWKYLLYLPRVAYRMITKIIGKIIN